MPEQLQPRCMLTTWVTELPGDVSYVAVAQATESSNVCLAYLQGDQIGRESVSATGGVNGQRNAIPNQSDAQPPYAIRDAVFSDEGNFLVAGSSLTGAALPGAGGEPTKWIEATAIPSGLDATAAGNSGALLAVNDSGQFVGDDDLRPIIHEQGQTTLLPLWADDAIGGANDLNDDRIVGYSNDDAVMWQRIDDQFVPRVLDHEASDTFGIANSISDYGIIGGSYRRATEQGFTTVGMLWNRDGSVLREFTDGEVTHVADFVAAIAGDDGSLIYEPSKKLLLGLEDFLRNQGASGLPEGRYELVDLERSGDGEQLLLLFQVFQATDTGQFLASIDLRDLLVTRQHPWNRHDVNGDGFVSPRDALIVINHLARGEGTPLRSAAGSASPFLDVDRSGSITPLDALQVINQLARSFKADTFMIVATVGS